MVRAITVEKDAQESFNRTAPAMTPRLRRWPGHGRILRRGT